MKRLRVSCGNDPLVERALSVNLQVYSLIDFFDYRKRLELLACLP
jgi:hypothetical protein